jgi:hypothetical protein
VITLEYRTASTLHELDDRWQIVARRPLQPGLYDVWVYSVPEDAAWRGARMLGAVVTAQARDDRGELILLAKRGKNRGWWVTRS